MSEECNSLECGHYSCFAFKQWENKNKALESKLKKAVEGLDRILDTEYMPTLLEVADASYEIAKKTLEQIRGGQDAGK